MNRELTGLGWAEVVARLDLVPLPVEGGYWAPGPRTAEMNAIFFLMTAGDGFSAMHRLTVTEGWQWLAGAPAAMLQLGSAAESLPLSATVPQQIVPAGVWQGCRSEGEWTLVSCWCAPAFTEDCFSLGIRTELEAAYPAAAAEIARLTR